MNMEVDRQTDNEPERKNEAKPSLAIGSQNL
jgi:hypothetical protein